MSPSLHVFLTHFLTHSSFFLLQVNLSVAKGSVLESAKRLKNFTGSGKQLQDKMDVVFISRTIENYLEYVTKEREVILK